MLELVELLVVNASVVLDMLPVILVSLVSEAV